MYYVVRKEVQYRDAKKDGEAGYNVEKIYYFKDIVDGTKVNVTGNVERAAQFDTLQIAEGVARQLNAIAPDGDFKALAASHYSAA